MTRIDHLVVRAETLAEGVDFVEAALGVKMAGGGEHKGYGTHNRLMGLGSEMYLEVIAPNPDEPLPGNARMFDMDRFSGPPSLSAWVLSANSVSKAMALSPQGMGELLALSRGDFHWLFSFPPEGRLPFGGAFPALIEWQSPHPAPLLPESGCRFTGLEIGHPEADELARSLAPLLQEPRVRLTQAEAFFMRAQIHTPAGPRILAAVVST